MLSGTQQRGLYFSNKRQTKKKKSQHSEEIFPEDVWPFSRPNPEHRNVVLLPLCLYEAHILTHISDEACTSGRIVPPYHKFINVCRDEGCLELLCSVVWFLISGQSFAIACSICVCASMYSPSIALSVCSLPAWGGCILEVYVVWEMMEREGSISEDISVPCLQPRTFIFLWFDQFFHVLVHVFTLVLFDLCYSKVLSSFSWYKVRVPAVAGLIGWTLQHWRLILSGFHLQSALLYFCSSTIGCLHICLAPIGQTKILYKRPDSWFGE